MGVTLATAGRNAAIAAIGALHNSGTIVFQTAANQEVATCTFASTAFGAPSTGVITAAAITADSDATGGTIAKAVHYKSDGTTAILTATCTATGGGGDYEFSSLAIGAGDTVRVDALTMEQPAAA